MLVNGSPLDGLGDTEGGLLDERVGLDDQGGRCS